METFGKLTSLAGDLLYTWILIPLLLGLGIYFTFKIKAGQITNIGHAKNLITAKPKDENAISPFKAFTISAASHIGTGNVVGVAAAISVGGPGSVFWMWITALIGGASAFVENTLGQIFKEESEDGAFKGGPAFYINKTMKRPHLAKLFSIIICIVYGFMFNAMQSNTIASGFANSFSTSPWILGLIVMVVVGFVIFGGIKRISEITSLVVPVMAIAYIGLIIFVLITNITKVPVMFTIIFEDAFNLKAGFGGLFGTAILNGVKRGLFSNEAGMGAVPNASAVADVSHPAKQGLIQALGVYLDSILICSATAFVIILAGEEVYLNPNLQGLDITQAALATEIGPWAQHFLTFCVLMFSFSSIIGNYYYGENNILSMNLGKKELAIYRFMVLSFVFLGSIGDFSIVWNTGDIFMGIMAIINLFILMVIGRCAVATYYDYQKQLKQGKDPVFNPSDIKELRPYLDEITAWDNPSENI